MSIRKHVEDFYGENPEDLDKWFEENKDTNDSPEVDWEVTDFTQPSIGHMIHMPLPPVPSKEQVMEDHKRMFESMVRSSGLTKEEFLKRIMEEYEDE